MSGPKIDSLTLERARERALQAEREEKLRKIREATELLVSSKEASRKLMQELLEYENENILKASSHDEMECTVTRIRELKREACKKLKECCAAPIPGDAESIRRQAQQIEIRSTAIAEQTKKSLKDEIGRIKTFFKTNGENVVFENFDQQMGKAFKEPTEFVEDIQFFKTIVEAKVKEHIEQPIAEQRINGLKMDTGHRKPTKSSNKTDKKIYNLGEIIKMLDTIMDLYNSEFICQQDKSFLSREAALIFQALKNSDYSEMEKIREEVALAIPQIKTNIHDMEESYKTYLSTVVILNQCTSNSVKPKNVGSFQSIEELEKELQKTKGNLKEAHEQEYIRKQLDEVMRKNGYGLCEDLVFDTSETIKGHHYLSKSLKNETALHIYSSNSQLMIEVVGTTSKERGVGVNSAEDLTEDEINTLLTEQGQFCQIHPHIVEELQKRGIILKEKNYLPVDPRFCRVIAVNEDNIRAKQSRGQNVVSGNAKTKKKLNGGERYEGM